MVVFSPGRSRAALGGRRRRRAGGWRRWRSFDLGLGFELHDLKAQRIPTPHFRVRGGRSEAVADARNKIAARFLGAARLAFALEVAYLSQVRDSIGAREETHRGHLSPNRRAVLVEIQRRGGIGLVP